MVVVVIVAVLHEQEQWFVQKNFAVLSWLAAVMKDMREQRLEKARKLFQEQQQTNKKMKAMRLWVVWLAAR